MADPLPDRDALAFLRAVLQSIEPAEAWRRYGQPLAALIRAGASGGSSAQAADEALARVLARLAAAARRHGQIDAVRDVRRALARRGGPSAWKAGQMPSSPAAVPIAEPAAAAVEDDFYSQAEWLAMQADAAAEAWNAGHIAPHARGGATASDALDRDAAASRPREAQPAARRSALAWAASPHPTADRANARRRRALEALTGLESQLARLPGGEDPLAFWLRPALADRLAGAGLRTLDDLRAHIERCGARWHVPVRGLGERGGRALAAWQRRLGAAAAGAAAPPTAPPLPPAFERWLARPSSESTRRAYRTTLHRFWQWLCRQQPAPSTIDASVIWAYRRFCLVPPEEAIRPRGPASAACAARPWRKPPGRANREREAAILASLMESLSEDAWTGAASAAAAARNWRREERLAA